MALKKNLTIISNKKSFLACYPLPQPYSTAEVERVNESLKNIITE